MKVFLLVVAGASVVGMLGVFFSSSSNSNNDDVSSSLRRHSRRLGLQFDPHTTVLKPRQSQTAAVSDSVSVSPLVADEGGGVLVKEVPVPLVYTYECPDHKGIETFLHKGIDPDAANMLSHLSGALTTVSETLAALRDTKIVLIGDSVMHQIYSSLSCMSHRAGAWESNTSFVGDRRVWLKNGSEIIFSPWGGNLLQFVGNEKQILTYTTNRPQMILSMTTRTG